MKDRSLIRLTADEVLASLNVALAAERQAAADYDAHAQACRTAGAAGQVCEALEALRDVEQEHAQRLAARITALGGTPPGGQPASEAGPQTRGTSLAQDLASDLAAEQWAIVEYARLVAGILDDDETAALMAELLADEIRHAVWLKATLPTRMQED